MAKPVTLIIDGKTVTVPQGTVVVDAAKKVGIDIPVFCYHPKMEPVGMCRMCLVDIGRPMVDRATGQPVLQADGSPKIQFGPKLDTSCTAPVSEGMVVITNSPKVADARREVLEFILTSHPLDCPICDKGGECPLQNLTMGYGPAQSRYNFEEKMHLAKHVPLGELIYLDRERCIQCGRCVRFQHDLADDPVIGFHNRGRSLEITTFSEPGFDSVFSGNTTDICPVGALTTADFRFGARPWELKPAASICSQCAVGCNLTMNVRRDSAASGKLSIKRIMPRQNESVNEIWICDKGRFGYHFVESPERLTQPMVRKNGELVETSWDEAIEKAAAGLKQAGSRMVALAGGRLANEDLYVLRKLAKAQGGQALLYESMGGGDLTAQVGLTEGSNIGDMGKGTLIMVIASDLHEEAPIWWLRIKAAVGRGATLIVAGARPSRLEHYASKVIRTRYGEERAALLPYLDGTDPAFSEAENAVIFYGSEGLDLSGSAALAQACADLLVNTKHTGRPNNGLVGVWPHANTQGAWELGFRPSFSLTEQLSGAAAVYLAAADPVGDDPALAAALDKAGFVVVQELFMTETARMADVVFPVHTYAEREGTYTSGERRVQRFYPAVYPPSGSRADYQVTAQVAAKMDVEVEGRVPSLIFLKLAAETPAFAGLSYPILAQVIEQWPQVGRSDLYYGGTGYENKQGLGRHLQAVVLNAEAAPASLIQTAAAPAGTVWLVPVYRLYDRGQTLLPSELLHQRLAQPILSLHPQTAAELGLTGTEQVTLDAQGLLLSVVLDDTIPAGVALLPRSVGVPAAAPRAVKLLAAAAESR